MKHVPKLPAEPAALAAYRANNPADAAAGGADAKAVWDRFRDDLAYGELRGQLVACQQGLCGYCEQRLTQHDGSLIRNDQQIEHVLPKSGGAGRTLAWTNVMLCCGGGSYREKDSAYHVASRHYSGDQNVSCGQRKGDKDLGIGCDPRSFPYDPALVNVGLDGTLSASPDACLVAGVDPNQLKNTINDVLNLNCERLRVARQSVRKEMLEFQVKCLEYMIGQSHLQSTQIEDLWMLTAAGRLQPDRHGHLRAFWTTERQCLEPWSSRWISENRAQLGFPAATCA